ncbi:hypothetical protein, partial [Dissulfurispira sp.]|uniref:hypothetical protein n=1 Tax=Dissulfurispira sp. TaxID=2817609 RepID=UPI002FD8D626
LIPNTRGIWQAYDEYVRSGSEIELSSDSTCKRVVWRTEAVNRICRATVWKREISLGHSAIEMVETLLNPKREQLMIETFFHFAPACDVYCVEDNASERHLLIKGKQGKYRFDIRTDAANWMIECFKGDPKSPHGWHFPDYGKKEPAWTVRISFNITEDFMLKVAMIRS